MDSQIGPSTCAGSPFAYSVGVDWAAERRQRDDRVPGAVEGGPDQLGHPGIEDDLPPTALADVEDGRDEEPGSRDEEPAGFDGEARRPAVRRDGFEERRDLAGESLRRRRGLAGREYREAAAEIERVEVGDRTAPQGGDGDGTADGVAPGVDRSELRADVEVDAAGPQRTVRTASGLDRCGDLGLGHPELRAARADRQPGERLGRHIRVEPVEDVEPWRVAGPARPTSSAEVGRLLG